jgi:hypothetical protein
MFLHFERLDQSTGKAGVDGDTGICSICGCRVFFPKVTEVKPLTGLTGVRLKG